MTRNSDGSIVLTATDEVRLGKLIEWAAMRVIARTAFAVQDISDFVRDWDNLDRGAARDAGTPGRLLAG